MDISKRTYTTTINTPRTATIAIFQLLGAMTSTLQTMQDTILILRLVTVSSTEGHIATIVSGLEHKTGIISAQMSWRFIMKCLLKNRGTTENKKAKQKNNNNGNKHKPAKNKNTIAVNK